MDRVAVYKFLYNYFFMRTATRPSLRGAHLFVFYFFFSFLIVSHPFISLYIQWGGRQEKEEKGKD